MNKIKVTLFGAFVSLPALISANAAPVCNTLSTLSSGALLTPQPSCTALISQLVASNQFPDVSYNLPISSTQSIQLCYLSNAPFNILWGTKQLTIQTASVWTDGSSSFGTPFILDQFGASGTGTTGTVATQWTISDKYGNNMGQIFTRDIIDLAPIETGLPTPEIDIIIGGTNRFSGARGTIQVSSVPQAYGEILVKTLTGKLCINQN